MDQQPILRTPAVLLGTRETRVPKGLFFYATPEQMHADQQRCALNLMLAITTRNHIYRGAAADLVG